ncbi:Hypp7324 [Branchiostoma lanceolatum]|uniref:Hypp7324 protein n=1 Tax=Branchiostoma lanceolatum TaxID=7740 RepID=A0A8K0ECW8_BRALA|nr:Hypp7324 [Branchiostoma lanceolatum]
MERFVGTWKPSKIDFEQLKKFYTSMGMPAAAMDIGKEEGWAGLELEVTENGTIWKYCNAPWGDSTITFHLEQGAFSTMGKSGERKGEFKMEGDAVITEMSFGGGKNIKTTNKITGGTLTVVQTFGDVSVESVFKKCG